MVVACSGHGGEHGLPSKVTRGARIRGEYCVLTFLSDLLQQTTVPADINESLSLKFTHDRNSYAGEKPSSNEVNLLE